LPQIPGSRYRDTTQKAPQVSTHCPHADRKELAMTTLLWTIIIFLCVVILAVVFSMPSQLPSGRRKLPRRSNRGGN
jgi:hypothetical protein